MKSERLLLWLAALAVFVVVCPVTGLDGRVWQEIVLIYGGFAAVAWALSGGGLLGVFSLWCLVLTAWHRTPEGFNSVLLLLAFLGVFALARSTGDGPQIVRVVVALNVVVVALQIAGAWLPLLRLVSPGATVTIFNALRSTPGLTSSTADLACVLAFGLPLCFTARWWPVGLAGLAALIYTSALSGIVAGVTGLVVLAWPRVRACSRDWLIGWGCLSLMAAAIACERAEIAAAVTDDRWSAWAIACGLWFSSRSSALFGHGLGSWQSVGVMRTGSTGAPELWGALHFDALQLGYEAGIVGVGLALAVTTWAALRSVRAGRWAVAGALVAVCVAQAGHFPFHLAAPSMVTALILGEAARA